MPLPSLTDVHVSELLTNVSIAYVQDQNSFIANQIAPIVPVTKQTNSYFVFDKGSFNRDEVGLRSPGTGFQRTGYSLTTASYSAAQYALEHAIPDEIRENADYDVERMGIQVLMQKFMIKRERKFVSSFMAGSTWGRDVAGQAGAPGADTQHYFWDGANADIINDLHKQCDYVKSQTGFRPNRFITSPSVWRVMMNDPDIIDRHKHTSDGPISQQAVANLCGIGSPSDPGRIVVMDAVYNSAAEGATASMGFMIGDVGLLAYVAPSPQIDQPSALYTFSWSTLDKVRQAGAAAISMWRDEAVKSDILRGEMYFDMKVVATDCGVFFTNLLT